VSPKGIGWSLGTPDSLRGFQKLRTVSKDSRNSGQSPGILETPDKTPKLRKGSRVDGKARGSREEWKWIGSPLTISSHYLILI
jgi:hypothetical protein